MSQDSKRFAKTVNQLFEDTPKHVVISADVSPDGKTVNNIKASKSKEGKK